MSMRENRIRCALITMAPFPKGNVSTIRFSSYLRLVAEAGADVHIFIVSPTKMAAVNHSVEGVHDNMHYKYMTRITWRNNANPNIVVKLAYYVCGIFKSMHYLRKYKINCIILYHQDTFAYLAYWLFCKIFAVAYLTDKSELPYGYYKMSSMRQKFHRWQLKVFDGFIVMTKALEKFYAGVKAKSATTFFLPMTINQDRYMNVRKCIPEHKYIAVVFGTHNRDGLYESLVTYNHYRKLVGEGEAYRLVLIGDYDKLPVRKELDAYIEENGLADFVDIRGLLPIDEVPQILFNASCLLTTPNEYVSGGFPTKLGEYMLSGVPIVATAAGEIPMYLEHGVHVLMAKPKDYQTLAEYIYQLQSDPIMAENLAANARDLVSTVFNADTYVESLIEYMGNMIGRKRQGEWL